MGLSCSIPYPGHGSNCPCSLGPNPNGLPFLCLTAVWGGESDSQSPAANHRPSSTWLWLLTIGKKCGCCGLPRAWGGPVQIGKWGLAGTPKHIPCSVSGECNILSVRKCVWAGASQDEGVWSHGRPNCLWPLGAWNLPPIHGASSRWPVSLFGGRWEVKGRGRISIRNRILVPARLHCLLPAAPGGKRFFSEKRHASERAGRQGECPRGAASVPHCLRAGLPHTCLKCCGISLVGCAQHF